MNADLVSISSQAEDDFVRTFSVSLNGQSIWIGLNDREIEGDFKWSDGTLSSFRAFMQGEPSSGLEDCVLFELRGWNDFLCDSSCWSICKRRGE